MRSPPSTHSPRAEVARLALGLAALGRPGYLTVGHGRDLTGATEEPALRARCHEVLDAAWAAGIRAVDAARSYGRAEAFLAAWLERRGIAPEETFVSTKWGYTYAAGWRVDAEVHEVKEHTLERFETQWPISRALLGSHVRLVQIHSYTPESSALDDRPLLHALAALKETGIAIGASVSGPRQANAIERLVGCRVDGVRLFDAVQATWNPFEPSAADALAAAHASGVAVIVKEALANGRLTDRGDAPSAWRAEAQRQGVGVDALALAAALARPWANLVILGSATVAQLQANLAALDAAWDERLLDGVAERPERYWQQRSSLPWT